MRIQTLLLGCALSGVLACGDDPAPPALRVEIFGYGPDYQGGTGFVGGLPGFTDMQTVNVSLLQPLDRKVLARESFPAMTGQGKVPEVSFGQNLRLDLEVLNGQGQVIASGATPRFDFASADDDMTYRIQVTAVDSCVPVGSVVFDSVTQERRFSQSRFDYRAFPKTACNSDAECGPSATCSGTPKTCNTWLGRAGHATAPLSDGRILIVGGGDPTPGAATLTLPTYRTMTVDVQFFDPKSGYFTEAGYDASQGDRLEKPIIYPTLTPIGDDKFILAGGFTEAAEGVTPSDAIYIIDARAEPGQRVKRQVGSDGQVERLKIARGWHAANYRPIDNAIVFTGGLGILGESDVLDTFEILSLTTGDVLGPFPMGVARAEHAAVMMGDGASLWVLGGRNTTGALASTEVITGTASTADANLRQARFGHGAVRVSTSPNASLVMVVAGYTDADGNATGTFEIGGIGRGSFQGAANWTLSEPRGRAVVLELPISKDIVVLGGRNQTTDVEKIERLEFSDLTATVPYQARDAGALTEHRYQATGQVLTSGKVLLIGGIGIISGSMVARDSAAIYNPLDSVPVQ